MRFLCYLLTTFTLNDSKPFLRRLKYIAKLACVCTLTCLMEDLTPILNIWKLLYRSMFLITNKGCASSGLYLRVLLMSM